ncbi:MAG: hypothetical protein IPL27_27865 [Lewinellaceae bacterium]|nr:hypothetical protein [Lewinellaceae bacterium]
MCAITFGSFTRRWHNADGVDRVRFVGLWNGEGGSGPGGTQNMVETVRRYAGRVSIIDTRQLFGL